MLDVEVPRTGEDDLRLGRGSPEPADDRRQARPETDKPGRRVRHDALGGLARRGEILEQVVAPQGDGDRPDLAGVRVQEREGSSELCALVLVVQALHVSATGT